VDVRRGQEFKIFSDTSSLRYKNELISLNLLAIKPFEAKSSDDTNAIDMAVLVSLEEADFERQVSFSINRNGSNYIFKYLFDTRQLTQRNLAAHILQGSLYEPDITIFLMRVLQRGDCFVDVGANIGFFTIIAAQLVGGEGAVYAFEPELENFKRLCLNMALNALSNVKPFQAAVGDANSVTNLYINRDNDGGHALWDPGAHSFNQLSRESVQLQQTELLTIDSVFNRKDEILPRIKIIKIDTEGYEHNVIVGALETIRQHRVPFILAEINRLGLYQSGSNELNFRNFMHHLGYVAYFAITQQNGLTLRFQEISTNTLPVPEDSELVYNLTFCLPGELEKCGFTVLKPQ
jgi:FkbM family methyltransferase